MKANIPIVLCLALWLGTAIPVTAGSPEHARPTLYRDAGGISADQAAAIVRGSFGGRIVSVKPAGNGWDVRVILDGGRVKTVRVDGNGSIRSSD